jgi:hypothetical protein
MTMALLLFEAVLGGATMVACTACAVYALAPRRWMGE